MLGGMSIVKSQKAGLGIVSSFLSFSLRIVFLFIQNALIITSDGDRCFGRDGGHFRPKLRWDYLVCQDDVGC